jgi:hypothetical protein
MIMECLLNLEDTIFNEVNKTCSNDINNKVLPLPNTINIVVQVRFLMSFSESILGILAFSNAGSDL